jgi:hypothetical protein
MCSANLRVIYNNDEIIFVTATISNATKILSLFLHWLLCSSNATIAFIPERYAGAGVLYGVTDPFALLFIDCTGPSESVIK